MIGIVAFAKEYLHPNSVTFFVGVLALGVALLYASRRWGRRWFVALFVGYWLISIPPGTRLLVAPLTRAYQPITDVRDADGAGAIVLLGGGIQSVSIGADTITHLPSPAALRTLEAARLFRLFGGRIPIVASGGTPVPYQPRSEADVLTEALLGLHVPRERIIIEDRSLTTHDESILVTDILRQRGIRRFILVTSPTHMFRSLAVFRARQADVIPSVAPLFADEVSHHAWFIPNDDSLSASDGALYDYAANLYYWAHGWLRPPGTDR